MTFQTLLTKYRKNAFSERDKGDRFERLMQAYLKTDPQYAYRFKNVWLWNEFLGRKDLGGSDTGKSAIEWIMERYQITTHKESNITNNPNDWAKEVNNPRYILNLLLSVINVSVKTVDIVEGLPELRFE
jgi:predicted helicase